MMQNVIISFASTLVLINRILNKDKEDTALFLELLIKTFLCGQSGYDSLTEEIIYENELGDFFCTPESILINEEIRKTLQTYLPQFKSYTVDHLIDYDSVQMINQSDCVIYLDKNRLANYAQTT